MMNHNHGQVLCLGMFMRALIPEGVFVFHMMLISRLAERVFVCKGGHFVFVPTLHIERVLMHSLITAGAFIMG